MALNRLSLWCGSRVPWKTKSLAWGGILPTHLLILNRGKKVQKKKSGKDSKAFKDFVQKREVERLLKIACLNATKYGEPLDPEMLNPTRVRSPPNLSEEEKERRVLLIKEWQKTCMKKHMEEHQFLQEVMKTRKKALSELKKVSETLYSKALDLNPNLFPLDCRGPTETPPIPGYRPPEPDE